MTGIKKDWVRRDEYDKLRQEYAHVQSELKSTKALIEPLPFAATANGMWNGDMLHDWIEGEPPENEEHRKLYRAIWAYRNAEFERGVIEGRRQAQVERAML